jgi:hypothetical protein
MSEILKCGTLLKMPQIIKASAHCDADGGHWIGVKGLQTDVDAPIIQSAEVGTFADDVIVLTYNEALDPASVPNFLDYAPAWAICPASITGVSIVGSTVHLQLSQDMYAYETIQLAYTAGANPVRDLVGNNAANFVAFDVTNNVTPEAQYVTVWNAFPTKPSAYNSTLFNRWMKRMVDNAHFGKAEFLDLFVTEHQDGACINWHSPGTFNPSEVNAPTWGQYLGYTASAAGKYIRSNFIPSVNGTLIGQDNICIIIGIGNNLAEDLFDFGSNDAGTNRIMITSRTSINTFKVYFTASNSEVNANSKKHLALSRGAAANFDMYINLVKVNKASASGGFANKELYIGGRNNNGIADIGNHQIRYAFLFSYLTEAEITGVNGVIPITEELLDGLGTGLY